MTERKVMHSTLQSLQMTIKSHCPRGSSLTLAQVLSPQPSFLHGADQVKAQGHHSACQSVTSHDVFLLWMQALDMSLAAQLMNPIHRHN